VGEVRRLKENERVALSGVIAFLCFGFVIYACIATCENILAAQYAHEPCARYETGLVDTKTPSGETAHVERRWCAEWKDAGR
jgi:hypothetical protein